MTSWFPRQGVIQARQVTWVFDVSTGSVHCLAGVRAFHENQ